MIRFSVDPRDAYKSGGACNSCCCAQATARPGETNKWAIDYTSWVAPMGGKGLLSKTQFSIDKKPQSPDPNVPVNTDYQIFVAFNTSTNGSVNTNASDPNGESLTYALVPMSGPSFGEITMDPSGTFIYEPVLGFAGYDRVFFTTSNGAKSITKELILKVGADGIPAVPDTSLTKDLVVPLSSVKIEHDVVTFALAASFGADVGDIYTMTVKQPAMDCESEYFHISCYDIQIIKC
jgi:hypothetical protein